MSFARFAALTLTASMLLAGCGQAQLATAVPQAAKSSKMGARASVNADFMTAAKKAIELVSKNKEYKNPRLVSISGVGLDQSGKLVALLGASWTFKFWVAGAEGDFLVNVYQNVEGDAEIEEGREVRKTDVVRVIDPSKLVLPTQLVPMAIKLGLKVSRQSPTYNYFDITYNASFEDPTSVDTDVADVTSYYRHEQLDGLHLPATLGFFPGTNPAPVAAPVAAPGTKPAKMSQGALAQAKRQHETVISKL